MKFSEKLKKLRKDNNITQDELAEKIFVSRTAISKWETDMGYPSLESLRLLSKVFGTTLDELVSDEDIENRKILDEKQSRKYFWITFVCIVCAVSFVIAYSITKIKFEEDTQGVTPENNEAKIYVLKTAPTMKGHSEVLPKNRISLCKVLNQDFAVQKYRLLSTLFSALKEDLTLKF